MVGESLQPNLAAITKKKIEPNVEVRSCFVVRLCLCHTSITIPHQLNGLFVDSTPVVDKDDLFHDVGWHQLGDLMQNDHVLSVGV